MGRKGTEGGSVSFSAPAPVHESGTSLDQGQMSMVLPCAQGKLEDNSSSVLAMKQRSALHLLRSAPLYTVLQSSTNTLPHSSYCLLE